MQIDIASFFLIHLIVIANLNLAYFLSHCRERTVPGSDSTSHSNLTTPKCRSTSSRGGRVIFVGTKTRILISLVSRCDYVLDNLRAVVQVLGDNSQCETL